LNSLTYGGALTANYELSLSNSEESGSKVNFKAGVGERCHVGYTRGGADSFETKLFVGISIVTLFGKNGNLFELSSVIGNG